MPRAYKPLGVLTIPRYVRDMIFLPMHRSRPNALAIQRSRLNQVKRKNLHSRTYVVRREKKNRPSASEIMPKCANRNAEANKPRSSLIFSPASPIVILDHHPLPPKTIPARPRTLVVPTSAPAPMLRRLDITVRLILLLRPRARIAPLTPELALVHAILRSGRLGPRLRL